MREFFRHPSPILASSRNACRAAYWLCAFFLLISLVQCLSPASVAAAADSQKHHDKSSVSSGPPPATFKDEDYELTSVQKRQVRLLEAFTSLWFLALGSAVGSFLNVVVYRMPLGISLGRPKSSCPVCKTPIKKSDNIPIVGWIRLRGRCRHCGVRISPRYLFVEAFVASVFVLLLYVELLSGGGNLPVRTPNHYHGVVWIIWYTKWDLVGIYLYHSFLLSVLTAASLIAWDGHAIPRKLAAWGIGVGLIASIFWEHLHPVPFLLPRPTWLTSLRWQVPFADPITGWTQHFGVGLAGFVDSLAGLAAGVLVGYSLSAVTRQQVRTVTDNGSTTTQPSQRFQFLFPCVLAGIYLGWQAVVSVACLSAVLLVILPGVLGRWSNGIRDRSFLGCIGLAVLLQVVAWRFFGDLTWWPNHAGWGVIANRPWWPLADWPVVSLAVALIVASLVAYSSRFRRVTDAAG